MFNMSGTEIMIILVLALVLIGPEELPAMARKVGKTIKQIQQAGDDLRDTFEREVMSEVKQPNEPPLGSIAKAKDSIAAIGATIAAEFKEPAKEIKELTAPQKAPEKPRENA